MREPKIILKKGLSKKDYNKILSLLPKTKRIEETEIKRDGLLAFCVEEIKGDKAKVVEVWNKIYAEEYTFDFTRIRTDSKDKK